MAKVFLVAWGVLATSMVAAHAVAQDAPVPDEPRVREERIAVDLRATAPHEDPGSKLVAAVVMG